MTEESRITSHLALAEAVAVDFYLNRSVSVTKDEVISESTMGLLKAHETFDPSRGVTFGAFAKTVIKNHLHDFFSRLRMGQNLIASAGDIALNNESEDDFFTSRINAEVIDPSREAYRNEVRKALVEGLSRLGSNQRNVMELIAQGYSYGEIAEKLEISKQAAQQAAQRAIKNLRDGLDKKGITVLFQSDPQWKSLDEFDLPEVLKLKDLKFSNYVKTILEAVVAEKADCNRYSFVADKLKIPASEVEETVKLAVQKAKLAGHFLPSDQIRIDEAKRIVEEEKLRKRKKRLFFIRLFLIWIGINGLILLGLFILNFFKK